MLEDAKSEVDGALTRPSLRGHAMENAFGGAVSFLRRRYSKDLSGAQAAVLGVPFDGAVTNRPGARFGPRAIREASTLQPFDPPFGWPVDPLAERDVVDCGDLAFDYADVPAFPAALEARAREVLEAGVALLTLGGDHSITLPLLRAHAARHGPLGLLQLDAHSDTWADPNPRRIDHGTFLTRALEEGLVIPARSVQVGIRTANPGNPVPEIDAFTVHEIGPKETAARVRAALGEGPCYVTFDIDCLDPAFAPGTGTPVPGGLSSAQAAMILRALAGLDVVGMDVVEVCPPFDHAGITAVAGAHVATDLLCLWASGPSGADRHPGA